MKFLFCSEGTVRLAEEVGQDQFSFSYDRAIARAKAAARRRSIRFDSLQERVKAIEEALDEKLLSLTAITKLDNILGNVELKVGCSNAVLKRKRPLGRILSCLNDMHRADRIRSNDHSA